MKGPGWELVEDTGPVRRIAHFPRPCYDFLSSAHPIEPSVVMEDVHMVPLADMVYGATFHCRAGMDRRGRIYMTRRMPVAEVRRLLTATASSESSG
jgi:hypothetical protein